jgi:hypothetical protein
MTKRESAIMSAITGISFGGPLFSPFHQYVEEKLGRPVFTHEMIGEGFWSRLRELAWSDFEELVRNIDE